MIVLAAFPSFSLLQVKEGERLASAFPRRFAGPLPSGGPLGGGAGRGPGTLACGTCIAVDILY